MNIEKYKRLAFIVVLCFIVDNQAFAQKSLAPGDTQSKVYYVNAWWTPAPQQGKYDTPEEAYVINKANFEAQYPYNKVLNMFVDPNPIFTYNGIPQLHNMNYVYIVPGSAPIYEWTNAALTSYECGEDMQSLRLDEYISTSPLKIKITVTCLPPVKPELPTCSPKTKNSIYPALGIEKTMVVDYAGVGANDLTSSRTYRSDRGTWLNNDIIMGIDLISPRLLINNNSFYGSCYYSIGTNTGKPYCYPYFGSGLANDFTVQRGHGRRLNFGTSTNFNPAADINDRVTKVVDGNGVVTGWSVYNASDDSIELFDTTGRIQTATTRHGQVKTYTYSNAGTPSLIAPKEGLLIRVTNQYGAQLNYSYDAQGRMVQMTDPAGGLYTWAYDEASSVVMPNKPMVGNLTSVTYPDGKKRIYWYNEQEHTSNTDLPTHLTGITDENGIRYSTVKYNSAGLAIQTELIGGVDKYTLSYPSLYGYSNMTDSLGALRTYNFQNILGVAKTSRQSQPAGAGCGASDQSYTYDANGNISSSTDFKGTITTYQYDLSRNLETKRVEASGKPEARTTSTIWHANYRIPVQIDEPLRRTTYTHDSNGNVLTKTEQATNDANGSQGAAATVVGTPRVWSYTYNNVGQVLTATGPRNDVLDRTTYTYDTQGNLTSVTNGAGHVTTMSNYDPHGHVGTITDPNGVVTNLTYHVRGWLLSRAVTADGVTETTNYDYDGVGQMTKVTMPDNSQINYVYDDAHRLTKISDHLGNSINYTLDNMGNRINETTTDATGALSRQVSRVYDQLNRLKEVTGSVQ